MVSNSRPSAFAFRSLAIVLAFSTLLFSQSTSSTGSIQGIVVDQTGALAAAAIAWFLFGAAPRRMYG